MKETYTLVSRLRGNDEVVSWNDEVVSWNDKHE